MEAAVFDFEDSGGEAVDEVAVVGDEEDGAGEVADGVEEDVFGAEIEVVGGLVEEEEVRGRDEHLGHGVAVALAAGEDAEFFEDVVAGEHEAAEEGAEFDDGNFGGGSADVVEHDGVGVEDFVLVLREEVGEDVVAFADGAGGRGFLLAHEADESGFACAVGAYEGDAVSALDGEVDAFEDEFFAGWFSIDGGHGVDLFEVIDFEHGAAACGRLRDGEVDGGFFFGDFDALDLFEFLDAGLDLFRFGGLIAEAVDEGLEGLDTVALIFVRVHQLRAALFFLGDVFFVVAVVDVHALVPQLDGFVDGDVEEVAVVRDEDVGVGVVVEIVFEPVAGFEIEVVGGLV